MSYKSELTAAMTALGEDPANRFIGYGLARGFAGGTIPKELAPQITETPVAENLMTGIAVGQSLAGLLPLVYFERFDFALNAADCIVNHLAAARAISRGQFAPAVILRCVVGNRTKPLFTGRTHTQNFARAFRALVDFPVVELRDAAQIVGVYRAARDHQRRGESSMIVEFKDLL
jgi:pyruvate/2-oxoglutarate/acetoin dehydrogenase E1 component